MEKFSDKARFFTAVLAVFTRKLEYFFENCQRERADKSTKRAKYGKAWVPVHKRAKQNHAYIDKENGTRN